MTEEEFNRQELKTKKYVCPNFLLKKSGMKKSKAAKRRLSLGKSNRTGQKESPLKSQGVIRMRTRNIALQ